MSNRYVPTHQFDIDGNRLYRKVYYEDEPGTGLFIGGLIALAFLVIGYQVFSANNPPKSFRTIVVEKNINNSTLERLSNANRS